MSGSSVDIVEVGCSSHPEPIAVTGVFRGTVRRAGDLLLLALAPALDVRSLSAFVGLYVLEAALLVTYRVQLLTCAGAVSGPSGLTGHLIHLPVRPAL